MNSNRIAVTGAAGMLGTAVLDWFAPEWGVTATDLSKGLVKDKVEWCTFDLLDQTSLRSFLNTNRPDVVIHCAALVNVDACEKNPQLAHELHVQTTRCISELVQNWNGKLVYISTDSVFNGQKSGPYCEDDPTDPLNVYARTKRDGECAALSNPHNLVLRTNIFGWNRDARRISPAAEEILKGLVEWREMRRFTDVVYTPIHVTHLAEIIERAIQKGLFGLYHATGSEVLSKFTFAKQMAQAFGLASDRIVPSSVENSGLTACRPKNMALGTGKLSSALDWNIPNAMDGLQLWKEQYDKGWVERITGKQARPDYRFWE